MQDYPASLSRQQFAVGIVRGWCFLYLGWILACEWRIACTLSCMGTELLTCHSFAGHWKEDWRL
jgi:hypothetical protein